MPAGTTPDHGPCAKVAFIWKIADKLRGNLKPHEYGSVMLPTRVLFRLDAVLEPNQAGGAGPRPTSPRTYESSPTASRTPAGTATQVDARAPRQDAQVARRQTQGTHQRGINEIGQLFLDALDLDGPHPRVKVTRNKQFGFARLTVERPMRRTWRVDETTAATPAPRAH